MNDLLTQRLAALREGRRCRLEAGQALKALRTARGWTQAQLAEQLGVSTTSVARMERGEQAVTTRTRRQLDALRGQK